MRATLQAAKFYADSFTNYDLAQVEYLKKKAEYDAAKAKAAPAAAPTTRPATGTGGAGSGTEKKPEEPKAPTAPEKPQIVETFEPYRALFAGRIPALVEARR